MTYRAEIDGLRAIAVLAVMLYHADLTVAGSKLAGGYLGVDIFFVISGYLITSLILSDAERQTFSYLDFYHRRARRLLPALLIVAVFTLLLGYLLLLPTAFSELGASVLAAMFFVSNLFFLFQDSYIAQTAQFKPFLHTWSLAVEEQFYLVFPTLLLLVWKHLRTRLMLFLALLAVASFMLSAYLSIHTDDVAFYLFPTRVWELMAGGMLAVHEQMHEPMYERKKDQPFLHATPDLSTHLPGVIGLVMIGAALLLIDDTLSEPSFHTLLPIVGTVMVIWYARSGTWVGKLLASRPMVACGLVSYSLYLWHQPLLVYGRVYWFGSFTQLHALAVLMVSVPVAYLSWRYIEQPARRRTSVATPVFLWLTALFTVAVLLFAVVAQQRLVVPAAGPEPEKGEAYLTRLGLPEIPASVIVIGDSHAAALATSLDERFSADRMAAEASIKAGCPYIYQLYETNRDCSDVNKRRRQRVLHSDIKDIVVIGRYTSPFSGTLYRNARGDLEPEQGEPATFALRSTRETVASMTELTARLEQDLMEFIAAGKRVYLLDPIPEMGINTFELARQSCFDGPHYREPRVRYDRRNQHILEMNQRLSSSGATMIPIADIFCDREYCHAYHEDWLYYDDDHPSKFAADQIAARILQTIRAVH